jgi:hypothetical protein
MDIMHSYKNNTTNELIKWNEYNKLDNTEKECYIYLKQDKYKFIDVKYDVNKITQDIIKKCYTKQFDFYNLDYYEYILPITSKVYSQINYVIFNSVNFTFIPVDNFIYDKILTGKNCSIRSIYVKNIVNIDIVNDILNSLVSNRKTILQYKKIVYNLIVKYENKQIFYDYNECLFTTLIKDLLSSISGKRLYVYSNEYYDEKTLFKKKLKTEKYRCVVIREYKNISFEKQIENFSELGFKNFIVCKEDKLNTMYNIGNFRNYLKDNKEIIKKCIKEENDYDPIDWDNDIRYDEDIFYRTNLLFTNFLKWCCIK